MALCRAVDTDISACYDRNRSARRTSRTIGTLGNGTDIRDKIYFSFFFIAVCLFYSSTATHGNRLSRSRSRGVWRTTVDVGDGSGFSRDALWPRFGRRRSAMCLTTMSFGARAPPVTHVARDYRILSPLPSPSSALGGWVVLCLGALVYQTWVKEMLVRECFFSFFSPHFHHCVGGEA